MKRLILFNFLLLSTTIMSAQKPREVSALEKINLKPVETVFDGQLGKIDRDSKMLRVKRNENFKGDVKTNEMVLSATNVLQYGNTLQGLTNEFVVKLKPSSSSEQLEELALQNKCVIEKDNWITAYHYLLSVSKTSELNSLQTANLFYETGLFEYALPDFVIMNAFGGTSISNISNSGAELFQNYPNPFSQSTVIRYILPQADKQAQIVIINTAGNVIRQIPLQAGEEGSITIEGGSLSAGVYYYSLYVDNSLIDTKQMILTK